MQTLYGGRMTTARLREVGSVTNDAIKKIHEWVNAQHYHYMYRLYNIIFYYNITFYDNNYNVTFYNNITFYSDIL